MQLIHNRSCPRRNCRPKPLLHTKCLTSFKKINLNKVKHVVCKTRDRPKNATNSQQVVSSSSNCRPKPLLNTKCLTSFTKINLNKVKHVVCKTRDLQKMQLIHNRSCPRRNCRPKPLLNTTCLTSFTKINLNKVKHVVCKTRDRPKNATNSQQVVSSSQLSSKTSA